MKSNIAKNSLLNTIGTFIYFFCQWLTTVVVVRITGFSDAGILSLAITFTNVFYFISLFGVRNYQLSDVNNEFSTSNYSFVRLLALLGSLIAFIVILIFIRFDFYTKLCCLAYMIFKMLESITDLFFTIFQKENKFKIILISYTAKGIISILAFAAALYITKNLLITIIVMGFVYLLVISFYDFILLNRIVKISFNKNGTKRIFVLCIPLVLFSLIMPYMNFITRYLVERLYTKEILGYYSSISLVVVVVSTLAGCIWLVIIPYLSKAFINKKFKELRLLLVKILLGFLILGIVSISACWLLGDFFLSLIFGNDILKYSDLLIPVVITSLALALCMFLSTVLISFKKNKAVLYCNIMGALVCSVFAYPLIKEYNVYGANMSMLFSITIQIILLLVILLRLLINKDKSEIEVVK